MRRQVLPRDSSQSGSDETTSILHDKSSLEILYFTESRGELSRTKIVCRKSFRDIMIQGDGKCNHLCIDVHIQCTIMYINVTLYDYRNVYVLFFIFSFKVNSIVLRKLYIFFRWLNIRMEGTQCEPATAGFNGSQRLSGDCEVRG